jgi:uncharacterized membrane protein
MSGRWHFHPKVRSGGQLTLGERAADRMRNGMGSWGFVFAALAFLAGWMGYNGKRGFDPYPFILLNLVLSCVAALQGAILLIAAKRSDQISSELAQHDFETDNAAKEIIDALHADFRVHRQEFRELRKALLGLVQTVSEFDDRGPGYCAHPSCVGAHSAPGEVCA